jgi:imidazole glycerol-phosphate synthase subunit HisF
MLTTRIIPCLDIAAGRVVKGVQFSNLRDAGCPVERAKQYEDQGGDELVMLDVSATAEQRENSLATVAKVRSVLGIPLTVGGGVKSVRHAERLLEAGADKVATNTAAAEDPSLLDRLANRFGSQCTVLALDAARCSDGWELVTHAGKRRTGRSAIDWAAEAASRGAGEIVLTSWDRDGTRQGYDCELIQAIRQQLNIPIIASGGAAHANHLFEGIDAGASAVLIASILHDGDTTINQLKTELRQRGCTIRP